jgi:serine phosphatase RsbU (regulator of sigma subunit)
MPIGYHVIGELPYTTKIFTTYPGDTFYMFTDGYSDQFGGPANTKFMTMNFKKLLLNLQHYDFNDQKNVLDQTIEEYRGTQRQVDDILVIGFRV